MRLWAAIVLVTLAAHAQADPILFLVAEPEGQIDHGDSYVLPLEAPEDVAHARALIEQGPAAGTSIAVATIAAGADGVNRDLRAPGAPAWSWHVTGFDGFADFTAEVLDGWPGEVERDVDAWIANTNGAVGFWSYTVVEELPEPDSGAGVLAALGALALRAVRRPRRSRAR